VKILRYILLLFAINVAAQHNSDYIQYMFNGALLNPAYCGSQNALNITGLYKNQWMRMDGAPVSESFSAHSPLKNKKINLGITFEHEKVSIFDHSRLNLLYAYRFRLPKGRLALGLQAGVEASSANWNLIRTREYNDPNFVNGGVRTISPIAGAGIHYDSKKFYLGLSCPQLLTGVTLSKYNTIILNSGFLYDISENIKIKPVMLIRYVSGSPVSANISSTFYYKELIGIGAGYTYNSSAMIFADIAITEQLHFGYGFNQILNRLKTYSGSTHEIMLRYLFSYKVKAISARYF
jgi:type IX secretion system PorP/SprF family membrane protein